MEDDVADDDMVSVALLMAAARSMISCFLFEYYVYLGGKRMQEF
jgi:hypothetical protein